MIRQIYKQEPLYTYSQWKLIESEERKKENKLILYYLKQKISGAIMVVIGVLVPIIIHDVTFSIMMVPLGIYLILTKSRVMMF